MKQMGRVSRQKLGKMRHASVHACCRQCDSGGGEGVLECGRFAQPLGVEFIPPRARQDRAGKLPVTGADWPEPTSCLCPLCVFRRANTPAISSSTSFACPVHAASLQLEPFWRWRWRQQASGPPLSLYLIVLCEMSIQALTAKRPASMDSSPANLFLSMLLSCA